MKKMAIVGLLGVGIVCAPRPTICITMSIVTVTAYCYPSALCPGSSKGITASGERVREGILAVSRDVEEGMNLGFGDRVLLNGLGSLSLKTAWPLGCTRKWTSIWAAWKGPGVSGCGAMWSW